MKQIKFAKKWLLFSLLISICFFSACSGGEFQETMSSGWESMINSVEQAVSNSAAKATEVAKIADETITAMAGKTETLPEITVTGTLKMIPEKEHPTTVSSLESLLSVSGTVNTASAVDSPFLPSSTETLVSVKPTEALIFTDTVTIEPTKTTLPTQTATPMKPTATFTETLTIEPTQTLLPTQTAAPVKPTATFTETPTIEPTQTLLPTKTAAPVKPTATFTETLTIEPTQTLLPTQTAAPIKLAPSSSASLTEIPLFPDATIAANATQIVKLYEPTVGREMTKTPIPVVEIETIPQTYQISSFVVTNTPFPVILTTPLMPEIIVEPGISEIQKTEIPTAEIIPIISPSPTSTVQIEIETISITPQNIEHEIQNESGLSDVQRISIKPVSDYDETFLEKLPIAMRMGEKTGLGFVKDSISENSAAHYLISAKAGQQLAVHVASRENRMLQLRISGSETGSVYQESMDSSVDWTTDVPVTQEFLIEVKSENNPIEFVVIISLHD